MSFEPRLHLGLHKLFSSSIWPKNMHRPLERQKDPHKIFSHGPLWTNLIMISFQHPLGRISNGTSHKRPPIGVLSGIHKFHRASCLKYFLIIYLALCLAFSSEHFFWQCIWPSIWYSIRQSLWPQDVCSIFCLTSFLILYQVLTPYLENQSYISSDLFDSMHA